MKVICVSDQYDNRIPKHLIPKLHEEYEVEEVIESPTMDCAYSSIGSVKLYRLKGMPIEESGLPYIGYDPRKFIGAKYFDSEVNPLIKSLLFNTGVIRAVE